MNNTLNYTISMLGPSRVGKTSLVATIFEIAAKELLKGKSFNIIPANPATNKKMALHARELRSSINAGTFNTGAVGGTQESFKFSFDLINVVSQNDEFNQVLNFNILDFPGGWLDNIYRPEDKQIKWEACKNTIINSSVLIIPIEATVIMEASTPEQRRAIEYNLQTSEIKGIVEEWAKLRNAQYSNYPSLVIFAPIKCETYFNDNANTKNVDKSKELYEQTEKYYSEIINTIQSEFTQKNLLTMLYCPVDTIGCVEIMGGKWAKDEEQNFLRFSGDYHITPPEKIQSKGGEDIFISLCKTLVYTQQMFEKEETQRLESIRNTKEKSAQEAKKHAEKSEGFFGNIKMWWTGEKKRRKTKALHAQNEFEESANAHQHQQQKEQNISKLIEDISKTNLSARSKMLLPTK